MNTQDEKFKMLLQSEWDLLLKSVASLRLSIDKCTKFSSKLNFSFEEQESFDSLSSKFNRTSDFFTQKVIRTIWMLLHEGFVPFIDTMNLCEKMDIIISAEKMITIRDLRNQIAHEYIPEALFDLIPEVIEHSEHLLENIDSCEKFIRNRGWL